MMLGIWYAPNRCNCYNYCAQEHGEVKKKLGWKEAQSNLHGHLGASGSGAESQGCFQHEHSDLEKKSTSALPLGANNEADSKLLRKHSSPHFSWPKCCIPTSRPGPGKDRLPEGLTQAARNPSLGTSTLVTRPRFPPICSSSAPPPCFRSYLLL